MSKVLNNLYNSVVGWFYTTYLGGLYFEVLLWIDRKFDKPSRYLTPREMATIVRESSQITEGIVMMKQKVNQLVRAKSKDEYQKLLVEIEDLVPFSEKDTESDRAKFAYILRDMYVKKGNKDVVTSTDKAKMIDQRIQDMYQLHDHIAKRSLLRAIRSARNENNMEQATKLEQEYLIKYGRSNPRHR
jgi:hypothetical protein